MKKKVFRTVDEKMKIIKETIRGRPNDVVAEKYNISKSLLGKWKTQFFQGGKKGLERAPRKDKKVNETSDVDKLRAELNKANAKRAELEHQVRSADTNTIGENDLVIKACGICGSMARGEKEEPHQLVIMCSGHCNDTNFADGQYIDEVVYEWNNMQKEAKDLRKRERATKLNRIQTSKASVCYHCRFWVEKDEMCVACNYNIKCKGYMTCNNYTVRVKE